MKAVTDLKCARERPNLKRPWISQHTLNLISDRLILIRQGKWQQISDLNKVIRKSARADRQSWVDQGLKESFWDPVKQVSKAYTPRV
eukprot:4206019-Alexandrium_andersonii.AAC.1